MDTISFSTAISATSREYMCSILGETLKSEGGSINITCGHCLMTLSIHTIDAIPQNSTRCNCKDTEGYLVYYGK